MKQDDILEIVKQMVIRKLEPMYLHKEVNGKVSIYLPRVPERQKNRWHQIQLKTGYSTR